MRQKVANLKVYRSHLDQYRQLYLRNKEINAYFLKKKQKKNHLGTC